MRGHASTIGLTLVVLLGSCSNTLTPRQSGPAGSANQSAASIATTVGASPSMPTASPSPVAGGCGETQVFAGPGPDGALGLSDNPWSSATPADAGIVAYFWHSPPHLLFAPGSTQQNKVLWINHGDSGGHVMIAAHPLDASSRVVHFDFPSAAGGTPSLIDLPKPGCWRLELAIGTTRATMDVLVAADQ